MRFITATILWIVTVTQTAGCASSPAQLPPALDGYRLSTREANVCAAAVTTINGLLIPYNGMRLAIADAAAVPTGAVPVYCVRARKPTAGAICFVPVNTRAIVIQVDELPLLHDRLCGGREGRLLVETADLLALSLLHECGHIEREHYVNRQAGLALRPAWNAEDTVQKRREFEADAFAAEVIRSAKDISIFDDPERQKAYVRLSLTIPAITWNLTQTRVIDNFGATALRLPSAFWERGYTHPNIEYRMLLLAYLLDGSPGDPDSVTRFEQLRKEVQLEKPPIDLAIPPTSTDGVNNTRPD